MGKADCSLLNRYKERKEIPSKDVWELLLSDNERRAI